MRYIVPYPPAAYQAVAINDFYLAAILQNMPPLILYYALNLDFIEYSHYKLRTSVCYSPPVLVIVPSLDSFHNHQESLLQRGRIFSSLTPCFMFVSVRNIC
jgi:hypothetical protein